jgi:2,3-bisphosphoglycerate-dependent phosphoglycerate mutase
MARCVYVVPHAEATHHLEHVVGGWHDSALTPDGHLAATKVAAALRQVIPGGAVAELYSSDLKRAAQTATPIGELLGCRPVLDARLREKSYGEAEGRPQAWLDERFIPPPVTGDRMNHEEGIAGAETMAAFARRIYTALADILTSPCEHQVIVSHGGTSSVLIAAWIKMPIDSLGYARFTTGPGSITTLIEDDFFRNRRVDGLGDTRHLG